MKSKKEWNKALLLATITVFYNIIEGIVSVLFGAEDETLSLFGFGLDSFIEVISGIGIWHMVVRIKANNNAINNNFEKTALRITGLSFYMLSAGLMLTAIYNIIINHKPETTFWGIVISMISIVTMSILVYYKIKIGENLGSEAIIADANCTKTCIYLSITLLATSLLYEIFKIGYIDAIGTAGIAYYSFKEGREAIEKSNGKTCCCHCN
jgi:divalent metal cation (Fe/Co/Zn/Cd) transporter